MSRDFTRFRQELGRACSVGTVSVVVAMFVTSYFSSVEIGAYEYIGMSMTGIFLLISSAFLLSNCKAKNGGKWKSMKIKKDTTIHYQM